MTWLVGLSVVALWLLWSILNRLEQALAILKKWPFEQQSAVPAPVPLPTTDAQTDVASLVPFAFSLEELALQRAYVEELTSQTLTSMKKENVPGDSEAFADELRAAREHLALMLQGNQQVRAGLAPATTIRDQILKEQLLPLGSEVRRAWLGHYRSNAFDLVQYDRPGLALRLKEQGVFVQESKEEHKRAT